MRDDDPAWDSKGDRHRVLHVDGGGRVGSVIATATTTAPTTPATHGDAARRFGRAPRGLAVAQQRRGGSSESVPKRSDGAAARLYVGQYRRRERRRRSSDKANARGHADRTPDRRRGGSA